MFLNKGAIAEAIVTFVEAGGKCELRSGMAPLYFTCAGGQFQRHSYGADPREQRSARPVAKSVARQDFIAELKRQNLEPFKPLLNTPKAVPSEQLMAPETAEQMADLLGEGKSYRQTYEGYQVSIGSWLVNDYIWKRIYPIHRYQNATLSQTFSRDALINWLQTQSQQDFVAYLERHLPT